MKNKPLIINCLKALFALLLACGVFACDTEDEPIPAYLEIRPFELMATNQVEHGSISQKITNGRIFFTDVEDGSLHEFGTITLPATIPVIVTGRQVITIDPQVRNGGSSAALEVYPFYERFVDTLDLPPNGDVVVQPTTKYKSTAVFEFIEDFEGGIHRFQEDRDDNPNTSIEISDEDVFEGNASGKIRLDKENILLVAATTDIFNFDFQAVGRVYMEVNYKTDIPIQFGVIAINSIGQENPIFEFVVLEKDEWNKIYFDMTNILVTANEDRFRFAIAAAMPIENGEVALDEAFIYLDNIKVVHF